MKRTNNSTGIVCSFHSTTGERTFSHRIEITSMLENIFTSQTDVEIVAFREIIMNVADA